MSQSTFPFCGGRGKVVWPTFWGCVFGRQKAVLWGFLLLARTFLLKWKTHSWPQEFKPAALNGYGLKAAPVPEMAVLMKLISCSICTTCRFNDLCIVLSLYLSSFCSQDLHDKALCWHRSQQKTGNSVRLSKQMAGGEKCWLKFYSSIFFILWWEIYHKQMPVLVVKESEELKQIPAWSTEVESESCLAF